MTEISRRKFLEKAAGGSAVAGLLAVNAGELGANPLGLPIGSRSIYPFRSMLKDFPAFVKMMAGIGVTRLELCSPIGYGADFRWPRGRERSEKDPGRPGHRGRERPLRLG